MNDQDEYEKTDVAVCGLVCDFAYDAKDLVPTLCADIFGNLVQGGGPTHKAGTRQTLFANRHINNQRTYRPKYARAAF